MSRVATITLSAVVVLIVVVWPIVEYRHVYVFNKRLRAIDPGRVYRGGEMTVDGFADAVARYKIHTVLNLQDDFPDPDVCQSFWNWNTVKESEMCRRLGVHYVLIKPDVILRRTVPLERPAAIDEFLNLMDDPDSYPVLIHCKAGLHRTGCLSAVYRMEYQGWSPGEAYAELKAQGFGDWVGTSANDYVREYVLQYRRGLRGLKPSAVSDDPAAVRPKGRKRADGTEDPGATD